jgi:hypothetical protein
MEHNINSGQEYAKILVKTLRDSVEQDFPAELLIYWCQEVSEMAINSYNQYITGKLDTYLLSQEEVTDAYERAGLRYSQFILNGLVDKDLVQVGVGPDGEILYSLTEKGKQYPI